MHKRGWPVRRVRNQWPALSKKQYGNRGAENYFILRRIIEECLIIFEKDDIILQRQLISRRTAQHPTSGKLILECT